MGTNATNEHFVKKIIEECLLEEKYPNKSNIQKINKIFSEITTINIDCLKLNSNTEKCILEKKLLKLINDHNNIAEKKIGTDLYFLIQKNIFLQQIDYYWKYHLKNLDYLRESIHLRAYGQKEPLNEFKVEAFLL